MDRNIHGIFYLNLFEIFNFISILSIQNNKIMVTFNSFKNFNEITENDVNHFWKSYFNKDDESAKLSEEWKNGYKEARKIITALDYPLRAHTGRSYSYFFDKEGNVEIWINHGCSWSEQNHIHHYCMKLQIDNKVSTCAWANLNPDKWKCLYDGREN